MFIYLLQETINKNNERVFVVKILTLMMFLTLSSLLVFILIIAFFVKNELKK